MTTRVRAPAVVTDDGEVPFEAAPLCRNAATEDDQLMRKGEIDAALDALADDITNGLALKQDVISIATDRLVGRDTAGTGAIEEIAVTNGLAFTGSQQIGIANSGVTLARMADLAQSTVIGRANGAGTGVPTALTASQLAAIVASGGGGLPDATYGDVIVSSGGTVMTLDSSVVTSAARTVLDDSSVGDMVNTLGGASSTGSGGLVRVTSPTLVTPLLGTPTSGTLTNCTGLPIASGVSGLAANIATFLATPSSANLRAALTDESGSGALLFANGAIGTPLSGDLANCTGLPADVLEFGGLTDRVAGTDGSGNPSILRIGTSSGQVAWGDHTHTAAEVGAVSSTTINADVTNNNATPNTIADVTGLSFAVASGSKYWFRFVIPYTAALTSTGSRWSINGPSTTTLRYMSEYTLDASTQTRNNGNTAYNVPAASNATSLTDGNLAIIEGFIQPSASGTVIARFASEVSSSAIVAKAGATVFWRLVA